MPDEPRLMQIALDPLTAAKWREAIEARKALRDRFALAFLPQAITDALRGYDHICDTVIQRAHAAAYGAADQMIAITDGQYEAKL